MRSYKLICGLTAVFSLAAIGDDFNSNEFFSINSSERAGDVCIVEDLDCRELFPVARLVFDPALRDFTYSALGWAREAAEDPTHTAEITARSGNLSSGVFTSDGSNEIEVMSARTGEGTCDWSPESILKKVYQLKHIVKVGGTADGTEELIGYLDFRGCAVFPSDADAKCEDELAIALDLSDVECLGVPVDLQEGVRTPKRLSEVLPFEYSSTNWIGDVVGVSAESVACVTICPLQGTDDDVTTWEEVSDKKKTLVDEVGEGQIKWRPHKGVWKATFGILNEDKSIHYEDVFFDLRNAQGPGLAIILK